MRLLQVEARTGGNQGDRSIVGRVLDVHAQPRILAKLRVFKDRSMDNIGKAIGLVERNVLQSFGPDSIYSGSRTGARMH